MGWAADRHLGVGKGRNRDSAPTVCPADRVRGWWWIVPRWVEALAYWGGVGVMVLVAVRVAEWIR